LNTSPLRINERTHIACYKHVLDLTLFPSNVGGTRILLFTVSAFHERFISESERHPHQSSGSFIGNSKYLSLPRDIFIFLVQSTLSADAQVGIGLSLWQDLANGMDSSDEEEGQKDDIRRRLR
jgi:hypothetical protein